MPQFLEDKLKKQYPNDPAAPYKIMNRLGYMQGSKETAAGKAAQEKHEEDTVSPIRRLAKKKG